MDIRCFLVSFHNFDKDDNVVESNTEEMNKQEKASHQCSKIWELVIIHHFIIYTNGCIATEPTVSMLS